MKKIDTLLLNWFQLISDKIRDWTGIDNFAIAFVWLTFFLTFGLLSLSLSEWVRADYSVLIIFATAWNDSGI